MTSFRTVCRTMQARDVPQCVELDRDNSGPEHFGPYVTTEGHNGLVVTHCGRIVAWACYRYTRDAFYIHRVCVAPLCRRKGYGRMVLEWFVDELRVGGIERICLSVEDSELHVHQWLRACEFWARADGDIYRFERTVKGPRPWRNRVRQHLEARP